MSADPPPAKARRQISSNITVPIFAALLGFGGAASGSWVSSQNNQDSIAAQRSQSADQFRRDQQQPKYDAILQQATRLQNAGGFSSSAVASGLFGQNLGQAMEKFGSIQKQGGTEHRTDLGGTTLKQGIGISSPDASESGAPVAGGSLSSDFSFAGVRASWQESYTALDQAISNAEIAGSSQAINYARAMRDKFRDDYRRSIVHHVDVLMDTYPDPKPDREKLVDALVGVPADKSPSFDLELLKKSAAELTSMYVKAAKDDLGLNDR